MERHAARIGSRSEGLAPTPTRRLRIVNCGAVPTYASAAIISCAADNSLGMSAASSTRVTLTSVLPPRDGVTPKISGGLRLRPSSFLRVSSLQSSFLKERRISIFHQWPRLLSASISALPALWSFAANKVHLHGLGHCSVIARSTPA